MMLAKFTESEFYMNQKENLCQGMSYTRCERASNQRNAKFMDKCFYGPLGRINAEFEFFLHLVRNYCLTFLVEDKNRSLCSTAGYPLIC